MKLNKNFENMQSSYLFTDIGRRVAQYKQQNPNADIIRLGVGDCTRPLAKPVVNALINASMEQGKAESFHGYGPEQGYDFLREGIINHYANWGVALDMPEVFVSDGAKSDLGGMMDLFDADNTVLIPDPVYPAYVDTNIMSGRPIEYISGTKENAFTPLPNSSQKADIIYLCSPNNPTGAAYTKSQLAQWVNYTQQNGAILLFDAAYEAFIESPDVPHSIYEVEGAKECVIEVCSLSKTAGFTGTRCGYTIVPKQLKINGVSLNSLWSRRQTTKFNETSYIVQKAAAEVFTKEGMAACMKNIAYYKNNAAVISATLTKANIWHSGGKNSPYIWLACPNGMKSWDFFDFLLSKASVVGTPGAGFGKKGEGYFRLTGFGDAARTVEATERLETLLKNL